jgi:hypothetical protein
MAYPYLGQGLVMARFDGVGVDFEKKSTDFVGSNPTPRTNSLVIHESQ